MTNPDQLPRFVVLGEDVCEWNPDLDRLAQTGDTWHANAAVIVGADGKWRLCSGCASLKQFARFRIRRPIHPSPKPDESRADWTASNCCEAAIAREAKREAVIRAARAVDAAEDILDLDGPLVALHVAIADLDDVPADPAAENAA